MSEKTALCALLVRLTHELAKLEALVYSDHFPQDQATIAAFVRDIRMMVVRDMKDIGNRDPVE